MFTTIFLYGIFVLAAAPVLMTLITVFNHVFKVPERTRQQVIDTDVAIAIERSKLSQGIPTEDSYY